MMTANGRIRTVFMVLALAGTGLAAMPAAAQTGADEARIKQLEAEVRALQRKVFPDGAGRTLPPQAVPAAASGAVNPPPATSDVTDILRRLDAIEAQLARLTGQTEENANEVAQLTTRVKAIETARAEAKAQAAAQKKAEAEQAAAQQAAAAQKKDEEPTPPSPERLAAVKKIVKPKTDDPGNDEYLYGYRLWQAGFYPEAEQQLRLFVDKYPDHWRTTYGRNLLGRAYLDDGKPKDAAPWFLKNYQADKNGARAPDSLLYLAESMMALKDSKRACIALAEFGDTYPAFATGRLKDQYRADKGKVKCD